MAVEGLRRLTAPTAHVERDGRRHELPARDVVEGDLVHLAAGDRVPADVEILEANILAVNEAILTGESMAVEKSADGTRDPALPLGDQTGLCFAGTLVVRGTARSRAVRTGPRTEIGRLAASLRPSPPPPIVRELRAAAWWIALAAFAVALGVAGVALLRSHATSSDVVDAILVGVALAVAAIPEGLLAIVTVSLALGAVAMARRGAILRELGAIEALGSASVLCVDKTGTLTLGELSVGAVRCVPGREQAFWQASLRCNDAHEASGDPMDVALLVEGQRHLGKPHLGRRVLERPFEPESRSMATVHETTDGRVLSVKGAPEVVLERCTPGADTNELLRESESMARNGLRVLAVADATSTNLDDQPLRALGVVGFHDPVRPSARDAVAACQGAGIRVVLVTGDHLETARAVAREVGIDVRGSITGAEVARLQGQERDARLLAANVVARVDSTTKVALVEAHRARGRVVAMMGDGVNDAAALSRADVGVAVAGAAGTDVARENAGVVLTNGELGTVVGAVRHGRVLYQNLRNVVAYLLVGNASEVTVVFLGLFLFPELAVPLLPIQILWINLITDGLPAVALGTDPGRGNPLGFPPRRADDVLLRPRRQLSLGTLGVVAGLVVLAPAVVARWTGARPPVVQTLLLLTLICVHLALAFIARSSTFTFERGWARNRHLWWAVSGSLVVQFLVTAVPPFRAALGVEPAGWIVWVVALGTAAAVVVAADAVRWGSRRLTGPGSARSATTPVPRRP